MIVAFRIDVYTAVTDTHCDNFYNFAAKFQIIRKQLCVTMAHVQLEA